MPSPNIFVCAYFKEGAYHADMIPISFLLIRFSTGDFNHFFKNAVGLNVVKFKGWELVGWLVGCFGSNGPLRQYFSLYRAVSQREGEKG